MDFYIQIAEEMGLPCNDVVIAAIECACVTQQEWEENQAACEARIMGAVEEML